MMIFGVAIAPLAEEMLFRGFLYPVLDRWLQTLFMTPRQLRRGAYGSLSSRVGDMLNTAFRWRGRSCWRL